MSGQPTFLVTAEIEAADQWEVEKIIADALAAAGLNARILTVEHVA